MQLFLKPNFNAPNFLNKFLFSLYWFNSKDWIKTKIRAKITPQYYKYEILKLEDLYNFEIAKLMHQFTHSKLPLSFNHYFAYHLMFHRILPATPQAMTFFYRDL